MRLGSLTEYGLALNTLVILRGNFDPGWMTNRTWSGVSEYRTHRKVDQCVEQYLIPQQIGKHLIQDFAV